MKKILIVEGNLQEENQSFSEAGIQTHTESLKDSLAFFTDKLETHVVNPSSDENIDQNIDALESYDRIFVCRFFRSTWKIDQKKRKII